MILYGTIIFVGLVTVSLLNIFFNPLYQDRWWLYLVITLSYTVIALLLDGLVALLIRKTVPEKWVNKDRKLFRSSEKEMRLYRALGVHRWKEYVPELGGFTGLHKNKMGDPRDDEYISRFILEVKYGILIHCWSVPVSFLLPFLDWGMYLGESNLWLTIALPISAVNAILVFLPTLILKFNLPKLLQIHAYNLRMQSRQG
jgi:hypothetical protein